MLSNNTHNHLVWYNPVNPRIKTWKTRAYGHLDRIHKLTLETILDIIRKSSFWIGGEICRGKIRQL